METPSLGLLHWCVQPKMSNAKPKLVAPNLISQSLLAWLTTLINNSEPQSQTKLSSNSALSPLL